LDVAVALLALAGVAHGQGNTEKVSVNTSGNAANNTSTTSSISDDGRFVAFVSAATNLAKDTNKKTDSFVRDRWLSTTPRVSVDPAGTEANGDSSSPQISGNGRFVTFVSAATNLVTGDSNGVLDVFVYDMVLATCERVSVDSNGNQG